MKMMTSFYPTFFSYYWVENVHDRWLHPLMVKITLGEISDTTEVSKVAGF